jgi:hypothetical protein
MASYPVSSAGGRDGSWAAVPAHGPKRPRAEMAGFAPSPSDGNGMYSLSPFMPDDSMNMNMNISSGVGPGQPPRPIPSPAPSDELADARAILNDFVLLSSTGHCLFETLSRAISQKTWGLGSGQRGNYFESLAQAIRANQHTPEINGLLQKFCSGVPNLSNLGQMIQEAQGFLEKSIAAITSSMPSPNYSAFSKSPDVTWTMYTAAMGAGAQGHSNAGSVSGSQSGGSGQLDDRKWVTPSLFSSLTVEQNVDINNLQGRDERSAAEGSNMIMDKTNARKKTVSALNRMKQFVVPSSVSETSGVACPVMSVDTSAGQSPNMTSLSSLPNFPYSVRPSFPVQQSMYRK